MREYSIEKKVVLAKPNKEEVIEYLSGLAEKYEDFTTECQNLVVNDKGELSLVQGSLFSGWKGDILPVTEYAMGQLLTLLRIPRPYYYRCSLELQARNFNYWMSRKPNKEILIRTWCPEKEMKIARAFFTTRYQTGMDDIHVFPCILEALTITEKKHISNLSLLTKNSVITALYVDIVNYRTEVVDGIPWRLKGGITITNSEVGASSVRVQPTVFYKRLNTSAEWHPLCDYTSDGSVRFRHIGEPKLEEIKVAVENAMEVASTALPAALASMMMPVFDQPFDELTNLVENSIAIPNAVLLILEADWRERQKATKGEIVDAIIGAVKNLPSFSERLEKELEVNRACARYLGLFSAMEEKIGKMVARAAQQVVEVGGY